MKRFSVLNDYIFYDEKTNVFLLEDLSDQELAILPAISLDDIERKHNAKTYILCLTISDCCNMNCKYCFNKNKSNKKEMPSLNVRKFIAKKFIKYVSSKLDIMVC